MISPTFTLFNVAAAYLGNFHFPDSKPMSACPEFQEKPLPLAMLNVYKKIRQEKSLSFHTSHYLEQRLSTETASSGPEWAV